MKLIIRLLAAYSLSILTVSMIGVIGQKFNPAFMVLSVRDILQMASTYNLYIWTFILAPPLFTLCTYRVNWYQVFGDPYGNGYY